MPPKSYFGYVEREADSYVNWADVGRTITNTVDEIDRVRTEKKAAIDAAYKEELERINNKPIGQKDDVNKWTIDMAYNAAENLKIQNNLLKSGKLAVKDYAIYLQNTSDSIKNLYGTIGQIQTAFQERLDRQANGENQDIEMWDGTDLEQYGKLTDLGANFNINGNLTFSRLETVTEDGKTITRAKPGSENLLSVNQLAGAVSTKYNKYDYLKDADDFIKRLGDGITAYRVTGSENRAGSITQITDKSGELDLKKVKELGIIDETEIARLKGVVSEYAKAEEEYIKAALNPKYNKSSILTEELGYKTTDNVEEAKKNPKLMLVQRETDGTITPIIPEGSDQDKAAKDFLRGQYRQMIDKKLEITTYNEPTPPRPIVQGTDGRSLEWKSGLDAYTKKVEMYNNIFTGNEDQKENALINLRQSPGVASAVIDPVTKILTVIPKDPDKPAITFDFKNPRTGKDGKPLDTRQLVFTIMEVADPGIQSKYGGYLETVPQKELNTAIGPDKRIADAEAKLATLKRKKDNIGGEGGLTYTEFLTYDNDVTEAEKELKDAKEEQLKMRERYRQGQGGGGTTTTTTKPAPPR